MSEKIYKSLQKVFSDSPKFRVPAYQREYSWAGDQIDQLLLDIENIDLERTSKGKLKVTSGHFIGLLVFIESEDTDGEEYYDIVDGQQRLSSITLITAVCRDIIDEYILTKPTTVDEKKNLINLTKYFSEFIYIENRPNADTSPKLIPNKNNSSLFEALVLEEGSYIQKKESLIEKYNKRILSKKYFKAYEHIYNYLYEKIELEGIEFMSELFTKIDLGLLVIPFVTTNDTDAFNLFETLNDRGLNLSALDLIKNKLLQSIGGEDLEEFDNKWDEIFGANGIIKANKANTFIRTFLMLRKGHIANKNVYKTCKSILTSRDKSINFLNELSKDAEYYRDITELTSLGDTSVTKHIRNNEIYELYLLLNKTRVKQWHVLGLLVYKSLKSNLINEDQAKLVLELLLRLIIRFKILNKRFNYIEKEFPSMATKEYNEPSSNSINDVAEKLQKIIDKYVSTDELSSVLNAGYIFDDNDLAYVILRKIAFQSKIKHGLEFSSGQKLSLEHVLPESHKKNWGEIKNVEKYKYSIGNMLLINIEENSQLNNKSFDAKKTIYNDIDVIDLTSIEDLSYENATGNNWVSEFILKREKDLVNQIMKFF